MRKFLVLSLFVLASCKNVKTPGGLVPAEYLAQAKKAAGEYRGTFQGVPTTLVISFDGDRPRVTVRNAQNDLLGRGCGSSVGLLRSVDLHEQDNGRYTLRTAYFDFAPGKCRVEGRSLDLSFEAELRIISADVLERTEIDPCFSPLAEVTDRDPIDHIDRPCHIRHTNRYLRGRFARQ